MEHWDRSNNAREAMVGGVAHSGRVVFAAAAVMNLAVPQIEDVAARDSSSLVPEEAPSMVALARMDALFGDGRSQSYVVVTMERPGGLDGRDRRFAGSLAEALGRDQANVSFVQDVRGEPDLRKALTSADGEAVVFIVASRPDPSGARSADGSPLLTPIFAAAIAPGESASAPGAGFTVTLESIGSYTGIIARRDPGAPIVWIAATLIVGGLAFTLRRPRTRLWLRITPGSRAVEAALVVDRGADPTSSARTLERVAATLGEDPV